MPSLPPCRAMRGLSNYMFFEAQRMAKVGAARPLGWRGAAAEGSGVLCGTCLVSCCHGWLEIKAWNAWLRRTRQTRAPAARRANLVQQQQQRVFSSARHVRHPSSSIWHIRAHHAEFTNAARLGFQPTAQPRPRRCGSRRAPQPPAAQPAGSAGAGAAGRQQEDDTAAASP